MPSNNYYLKKKRLRNQLLIKLGIINAGNDSKQLKKEVQEIINQMKATTLRVYKVK